MKLESFRKKLHQHPELSNDEHQTAQTIVDFLKPLNPDALYTGVGGTGVVVVFDGDHDGDTVLFRCELDALPIDEPNTFDHRSVVHGVSHKCGHDGHMAIICGLAQKFAHNRRFSGRRILLFQPAEETGMGAMAVTADETYQSLKVDYCYALHNLPGIPLGQVQIRAGTFNCASRGLSVKFHGESVHAAYPEQGRSPADAMTSLLSQLLDFKQQDSTDELQMLTVVYAKLGEHTFGTTPALAEVAVTLRAASNPSMDLLVQQVIAWVEQTAERYQFKHGVQWHDIFLASVNDEGCAHRVAQAAVALGHVVQWLDQPLRWSEDFGALSQQARGAMFVLGAGEDTPQIHSAHYDFPDALIERGIALFEHIAYAH